MGEQAFVNAETQEGKRQENQRSELSYACVRSSRIPLVCAVGAAMYSLVVDLGKAPTFPGQHRIHSDGCRKYNCETAPRQSI